MSGRTSELIFKCQEALRRSGDLGLAAVSLVDLCARHTPRPRPRRAAECTPRVRACRRVADLKDRVRMQYASGVTGELRDVGKANETTPEMIRAAKSLKLAILPPTTR